MKPYFENRTYDSANPLHAFITDDFNFLAHWHNDIEIAYVLDGSIRIGINREFKTLTQGELAICNSRDIHYYDSRDMHSKIIIIIFHTDFIKNLCSWPQSLCFMSPFIESSLLSKLGNDINAKIQDIFLCLVKECHTKDMYYDLFIKSKLLELLALVFRNFSTNSNATSKESNGMPYIKPMQDALLYIEENYMKDITLQELAHKVNFSPFYLSRLFKQVTGINFKAFLNTIRVENARNMISSSTKSIAEISYECGFNSIRAFNRSFRSITGYTPSHLRKRS